MKRFSQNRFKQVASKENKKTFFNLFIIWFYIIFFKKSRKKY